MVEPTFGIRVSKDESDTSFPQYDESDSKYYQLGVGLYGFNGLVKDFEIYYGGSIGTGRQKVESKSSGDGGITEFTSSRERTDYFIQPTLGIGYVVNENFLLSIDVGLAYYWGEEEFFNDGEKTGTRDTSSTSTSSRLLLRYLF